MTARQRYSMPSSRGGSPRPRPVSSSSSRAAAGEIIGLRDRCCHRLAPLSKGRKEGDCVRCGYHGLLFDATGRCIEIPGADTVPREGARAALSDRAEEQVGVRLDGRPGAGRHRPAARQLLVRPPDWDYVPGYLHYDTPQQLICDNLLDFSHLSATSTRRPSAARPRSRRRGRRSRACRAASASRARSTTCRRRPTTARCAARRQSRPLVHLRLPAARARC